MLAAGLSCSGGAVQISFLLCNFEVSQGQVYRLLTGTFLQADLSTWPSVFLVFVLGAPGRERFWSCTILAIYLFSPWRHWRLTMHCIAGRRRGYRGCFRSLCLDLDSETKDSRFAGSISHSTFVLFVVSFLVCFIPHLAAMPGALRHSSSSLVAGSCGGNRGRGCSADAGSNSSRHLVRDLAATLDSLPVRGVLLRPPLIPGRLANEFATLGRCPGGRFRSSCRVFPKPSRGTNGSRLLV